MLDFPGKKQHRTILGGVRGWGCAVLSVIVGINALLAALLWFGQRSLIYHPDRSDPGFASAVFEAGSDITLSTDDGLTLRAWRVDPREPNGMAALYLPGNGGNRLGRATIGQGLADEGFTVLLLDYRGYGANPGSTSEEGLLNDARAAAGNLADVGFHSGRAVYVGESIGTGSQSASPPRHHRQVCSCVRPTVAWPTSLSG